MTNLDRLLAQIRYRQEAGPTGTRVLGELRLGAYVDVRGYRALDAAEVAAARTEIQRLIVNALYGELRERLRVILRSLRYWDGQSYPVSLVAELSAIVDELIGASMVGFPVVAEDDPDKQIDIPHNPLPEELTR
jgi:hypothetical protein